MNSLIKNSYKLITLLLIALVFLGCQKDEEVAPPKIDANTVKVNNAIYELMKEWYLWNDKLPTVDVAKYKTPQELLDALTYKTLDRWSFIQDEQSFDKYFSEGAMVGFGFGMKLDAENKLRVSFVYKNSPMDKQSITRGYTINKINGSDVQALLKSNKFYDELGEDKIGVTVAFEVEDLTGNKRNITVAKEEVNMNPVLYRTVKNINGKKVGYLVFNTFIEKANEELNEAFSYFKAQGATDVILDLRYNGGGSLEVADHLAELIGGTSTSNKTFVQLTYNPNKQSENFPFNFGTSPYDLSLSRIFVITSRSSASASEAVINGLEPYMKVLTIGDDTHGKPVGMNVWKIGGYAVGPITFKVANANGQADYYGGIKADEYSDDNLNYLLGDEREHCIKEALYYIQNGTFFRGGARVMRPESNALELKGFRAEIGAF